MNFVVAVVALVVLTFLLTMYQSHLQIELISDLYNNDNDNALPWATVDGCFFNPPPASDDGCFFRPAANVDGRCPKLYEK